MSTSKTLFIFPGQGSQYSGMGADLYADHECVRRIYQRATDTLGYDVAEMSFGESNKIHLTRFTQPLLLTHSLACLEAFKEQTDGRVNADFTAGHSLGEYSAMVAAGVLSVEAALTLVNKRGELMGELGDGEMSALALDVDTAQSLASKHYCAVAGCNLLEQTVVGGLATDLERLEAELKELHPKKSATRLKTEGAFHTFYMVGAALAFRESLANAEFTSSATRVMSNYSGEFHDGDVESMRAGLFFQLFHPVLWHRNLLQARESGVRTIIEFGGGIGRGETAAEKKPNLAAIVKRAYRGSEDPPAYHAVINQGTLADVVTAML